jgi:hypothetical protein
MLNSKSIFFGIVGLCVVLAAANQFWFYSRVESFCPDINLHLAPLVAGGCLTSSFVANMGWLVSRRKRMSAMVRIFLFVWVMIIAVGLIAVGATFGQSTLYSKVCPALDPSSVFGVDIVAVQTISAVLLILSIATPHVYKKKTNTEEELLEVSPVAAPSRSNAIKYKPLTFLNPRQAVYDQAI